MDYSNNLARVLMSGDTQFRFSGPFCLHLLCSETTPLKPRSNQTCTFLRTDGCNRPSDRQSGRSEVTLVSYHFFILFYFPITPFN